MADPRIERIEQGIAESRRLTPWAPLPLADLRAWQEIAERHRPSLDWEGCDSCHRTLMQGCLDRQAADAALDRLDALWAGESRG